MIHNTKINCYLFYCLLNMQLPFQYASSVVICCALICSFVSLLETGPCSLYITAWPCNLALFSLKHTQSPCLTQGITGRSLHDHLSCKILHKNFLFNIQTGLWKQKVKNEGLFIFQYIREQKEMPWSWLHSASLNVS